MRFDVAMVAVATLAFAAVLTGVVLRLSARIGMLDIPNERSSHATPIPRGGGIAIVIANAAGLAMLGALGAAHPRLLVALLGGGSAVAMIGFLDDRHRLSARVRLAVHAAAALFALIVLDGLPAMQIGDYVLRAGWGGYAVGTVAIVWVLNLFNFMDGIDGIAAAEAIFVVAAGALVPGISDPGLVASSYAIVFAAACVGFLFWNWSPARIFMGDVGSGYLGYIIAVLAIASAHDNPTTLLAWLILGGVFFCDATVTLIRRLLRHERVHEAHRSHAYQWLARRWHSHARVAITVTAVNLCWLLPCALFAVRYPELAAWTVLVAFAPLVALALFTGAGRAET
jgi:Fuc2NAc and GlcNAc transferase